MLLAVILTVVILQGWLPGELRQVIAKENNVENGDVFEFRWSTPGVEVVLYG